MLKPGEILTLVKKQPRWRWVAAAALLVAGFLLFHRGGRSGGEAVLFTVRRGPLDINVLVGGNAQALESQEIKCEVRVGYQGVKILKIVEEGYQVTEDDVRTNKVLVELDSSDIQKQIVQQEIQYQSAAASLTDAQQGYDIQVNQNLSDIKAAEQKAKFARMDFDKFLGDKAAEEIIVGLGLTNVLVAETTNAAAAPVAADSPAAPPLQRELTMMTMTNADAPRVLVSTERLPRPASLPTSTNAEALKVLVAARSLPKPPDAMPSASADAPLVVRTENQAKPTLLASLEEPRMSLPQPDRPPALTNADTRFGPGLPPALTQTVTIDFSKYADIQLLGDGEAKQKLRKFEDDLQLAKKQLEQDRATLEGTKRLFDKGFVTKIDRERDDIAYENSRLKVQTAATAQELFLKYEFLKSAEEALSKYLEAARELDRARKAAISKLAQAEARLRSAEAQYNVQLRQRKELNEQLGKCLIRAEKPGLVVYGGGEQMFFRMEEQVREGGTVRERQSIITIPDMTKMSVKVKIHESYIKKVKKGQKARITVESFADQVLEGEVTYVGVLPDSQDRWMNPDMKVYRTTVTLNGTYDWLKPGMSAKVEIMADRLDDVVYVPIQAVVPSDGKQVCYVVNGRSPERREVEVGQFNDSFIEIKSGLKEGEKVLLRPPESQEQKGAAEEQKPMMDEGKPPPSKAPPPSSQALPTGKA